MKGLPAEGLVHSQRPRRFAIPGVAVASALAVAAAIALWVSSEPPRGAPLVAQKSNAVVSARPLSSLALTESVAAEMVAEAPPVSIESVDFGATQGAIFLVSAGVTDTMVVWTLDEPLPRPVRPRR
jgi:hypothetical protein